MIKIRDLQVLQIVVISFVWRNFIKNQGFAVILKEQFIDKVLAIERVRDKVIVFVMSC